MPGGLPDVEQRFTAESSGYSSAIAAMIRDNQALVKSIGDAQRKIRELGGDLGALGDRRIRVEVTGVDDAIGKVAALRKELDGLGDRHVHIGGDGGEMVRHLKDISTYMDIATDSMGRMEEHLHAINRNARDSSASLDMQTQMLRDNADAHNAAASAVSALSAAHQNAGGGGGSYIRTGGGGGGGGSRGGGSGSSGGGGDLPGGGGAFVPWRGGGFQAVKFWGMAIAEFAATAVPALIAAGSAAAVGMQGAQDVMIRAKAISAASESIGPAFGQSTSSYLGLPGTLGQYQDRARGGVYELAGAGINFARMGKGTFGQMGLNTLSMIDRGSANMLINYQKRQAAGGGMGDLLGGGTEWLRRYGDLFSNLGSTVMNLAPYEPGFGGDVLNTLVGGTGLLKQVTQDVPGPILGAIMAAEGGQRWGKALLGGKGLLGRVLGLGKVGGIGGLLGKAGGALAERAPLGSGLESLGFGLSGLGGGLAEFGGPISIAAALSAYGMSYLASTMPTAAQRRVAGLQAGIGKAGFSAAFQPLAHAIVTTSGLAAQSRGGSLLSQEQQVETPYEIGRFGPGITPTYAQTYAAAAQGFGQTMTDLIGAGPQLVTALKKAGLKSVSMGDAFQIAQNALLDLPHAFGKDGKLNPAAKQMLANYVSGVGPMTRSGGGFNAAIDAQQIMSSPAMKSLSQVNQAMDSMTQIMSGGPAGMATLFGMLGGTPTTTKHGGLKLAASPAMAKMARALTSFTTPGGAAAWNTFAGSQGFVAAEQQNLDQLRTAMTLGALTQPQAAGLAGFQIQQMLPMAKKSPAALAMLMQQEQQMGIGGYYDPSKTQGQNYQAAVRATAAIADNSRQANAATNHQVVALSRLPALAQQFSQGFGADVMSKQVAAAATSFSKITAAAKSGKLDTGAIGGLTGQLKAAFGGNMGAVRAQIQQALSTSGLSAGMQKKIMIQVDANTGAAQAKINGIHGKTADINIMTKGAQAAQAAMDRIHGKTVTVTIVVDTINKITNLTSNVASTYGGGLGSLPGGPAGMRLHHQAGYRVPGYGGGDTEPAMLEPGEAVVPKHLVPALAGFLGAHKVPGFAGGGFVGQQTGGPLAYWGAGSSMAMWNPAFYAQLLAAMRASQGLGAFAQPQGLRALMAGGGRAGSAGPAGHGTAIIFGPENAKAAQKAGSQFTVHVIRGMHDGMKDTGSEARKLARSLVAKLQQEVQYAKGAADAAAHGQGYDPSGKGSGIFGNMDLTSPSGLTAAQMHPAGPNSPGFNAKNWNAYVNAYAQGDPTQGAQSVQDQMKSYLKTEQSFGKDIGRLRKGHLNKQVLAQLIAAGPQQGDALAQSILGGQGGVGAVNKLWGQIQKASKNIGAQAAMGQFGGHLSPDLKNATVVGKGGVAVNISVNAGKSSTVDLTKEQVTAIVAQVQAALLKQAKRNTKTGTKLPGKNS